MRAQYLQLAAKREFVAALTTAEELATVELWGAHPVYLLELGVLHFSSGNYVAAGRLCGRALEHLVARPERRLFSKETRIQAHVCVGVAETHQPGMTAREQVLTAFHSAWQLATDPESDSSPNPNLSEANSSCADFGVTSSPMLAAPLDSIAFNLLRAYERYELFGRGLRWLLGHLRLPALHRGGAYVVAFAVVRWSEGSRALIDGLEAELRRADQLDIVESASLWGEVKGVQNTSMHLISLANLCLNKIPPCSPSQQDTDGCFDSNELQRVWRALYDIATAHTPELEAPVELEVAAADTCGADLITQYYQPENTDKLLGINAVLQRNLNNPLISQVYLLNEREHDFTGLQNAHKIFQYITGKRLSFSAAFQFANQHLVNRTVILGEFFIHVTHIALLLCFLKIYTLSRTTVQPIRTSSSTRHWRGSQHAPRQHGACRDW